MQTELTLSQLILKYCNIKVACTKPSQGNDTCLFQHASEIMVDVLWFKFILGLMFFELVSILFAIVPDYGNEYMTKENNN